MENQSYYRIWDNSSCNESITDRYLIVNCTGCCVLSQPFTSHSITGRKDYYLLYLCKGAMHVLTKDGMRDMEAGQLILFSPNREYKYTRLGDEEVVYYWAHFTGYGVRELLDHCRLYEGKIIDIGINEGVIHEFGNMFTEFIRHDFCFETAAASHLTSICVNLGRSIAHRSSDTNKVSPDRIYTSIEFIHKNFNTHISVEQLAQMEHISISRYRTIFKECTGFSPLNYIIALRIKRACELIVQTDLTLKEIAESVGYHDQLYFSRIFKTRTGISPGCYKDELNQNYS